MNGRILALFRRKNAMKGENDAALRLYDSTFVWNVSRNGNMIFRKNLIKKNETFSTLTAQSKASLPSGNI